MTQQVKRAVLIAVGTELTSGQIVNTNGAWISQALQDLHIDVLAQLVVADSHDDINLALKFATEQSQLVIITGGLGPTSDDFTRNALANFLGKKLVFSESQWKNVCNRLQTLGVEVSSNNQQQCYFPHGAYILENSAGTAAGFGLVQETTEYICLPGPPREIKAIWKEQLKQRLQKYSKDSGRMQLFRWHCLGMSESLLAEKLEAITYNSSVITGYRPHFPYVELKCWVEVDKLELTKPILNAIETTLSSWIVAKEDEDIAELCLEKIANKSLLIIDAASQGLFSERLNAAARKLGKSLSIACYSERPRPALLSNFELCMELSSWAEDLTWNFTLTYKNQKLNQILSLPYKSHSHGNKRRYQSLTSELTLVALRRILEKKEISL